MDCRTPPARTNRVARVMAPIEAFFVRYRDLLRWIHAAMFFVFLGVVIGPALLADPPSDATPFNNVTAFAGYILWGLWFPLVFLSVIFSGRSWCGLLCPMGAASEWANLAGPRLAIPRWLAWEGTPVASFVVTTVLGQTLGVRDHPGAAAEVFGGTMLAAIVIGFLFGRRKRAWCRHMCPIGRILGLYSRLGAVQFSPKVKIADGDAYSERGVCPMMIDLPRKTESRHCIECFRCVNPGNHNSIRLEPRRPGVEIEQIRDFRANPIEVWFLFLDTGVALGGFLWLVLPLYQDLRQMFGEWAIDRDYLWLNEPGPAWLMSVHPLQNEVFLWLDFIMIIGFMLGCMVALTAVLATLTSLSAKLAERVGADGDFRRRFTELGYQYTPVAMVSLVIGLGGKLFEPIQYTPLGVDGVHAVKGALFFLGLLWSIWLGDRILVRQGVPPARRWLPLLPGLAGSVIVGIGWWPAIFGL